MPMTPAQSELLSRSRLVMLRRLPYFGTFILGLPMEPDDTCDTAYTNGRRIRFNPKFLLQSDTDEKLPRPVEEVVWINCHEVLHVSFKHPLRTGWREHQLANIAQDYAINGILEKTHGLKRPAIVKLYDHKYDGWAWEDIYDDLLKQCVGGPKGKIKLHNIVFDLSGVGDLGGAGGWELPSSPTGGKLNEAQKNDLDREISGKVATAAAAAKQAGKGSPALDFLIKTMLKPKIDWRPQMWSFIHKLMAVDTTWSRPHRKYMAALDLYVPSVVKAGMGEIACVMDTSGSVGYESEYSEGAQYFSEIKAIAQEAMPSRLHVIYCDDRVHGMDTFEVGQEPVLHPRGRGGTDFRPPFLYLEEKQIYPECLYYLTDMRGPFPEKPAPYPVMWVATSDIKPPWGEVIRLQL